MNKLIKDGNVAVLVSPGYGAGWSTWNSESAEELCMDAELAQAVLDADKNAIAQIAARKWPDAYDGGLEDLEVVWLPEGTRFYIHEYDGNESIRTAENLTMTA